MFKRFVKSLLISVVSATGLLSLGGYLGRYAYLLNLTSHFRVQYVIGLLVCALLLWLLGKRKFSLLALSFILLNLAEIIPLYLKPNKEASVTNGSFSLLQMNILSDNQRADLIIAEIERLDPDVVVMEEVMPDMYDQLAEVRAEYPYVVETLHRTALDVLVLSRLPMIEAEVIDFNDGRLPSLVTELTVGSQTITLIATHPLSPRSRTKFELRNEQLYAIAEAFQGRQQPLLMVGDLNITSFSPVFKKFIDRIGLYDSRRGFGVQPSWPAKLWPILRIAIDHCLLSHEFEVTHREIGRDVGSDHLPVFVQLKL